MKRALELALKNSQGARPNPSVGAVIVSENRVIGEGFTSNYGGNHAEINALHQIRKEDLPLLKKATLYVTLEPCSHTGKTPRHFVGHGPHALANLRTALQAAGQTDIDIAILV